VALLPKCGRAGSVGCIASVPHNLPLQLTSFIGREHEIGQVKLALSNSRLVTLTGPGGVGKTRLALEVATQLLDDYADGIWLVELADLADPRLVAQAIGGVFGLREEGGRSMAERLQDYLGARELLLVLDNCEHLLVGCAPLASALLRTCPGVGILATSREALNIPGETGRLVPSLSAPDAEAHRPMNTAELAKYDAVRLFVERATSIQPAFELTTANASAVAQVCRRLDGIPLAIELAAARVKVLSVHDIAERLDDVFRLLTRGGRDLVPRHQTLRSLIDWSYELLSDSERALLRRLSVFAGGWTLKSAEAVCATQDEIRAASVLDLLSQLVDKSLVVVEHDASATRYHLLETLRQYGAEKLRTAAEEAASRDRHLVYFLALAEAADPALYGAELGSWLDRLEMEIGNLRAALQWSRRDPSRYDAGLRISGSLWRFWYSRGHLNESWAILCELLELAAANGADPPASLKVARARALNAAGRLGTFRGDLTQARVFLDESLLLHRELRAGHGTAVALRNLGIWAVSAGELNTARSYLEEALQLIRTVSGRNLAYTVMLHLGWVAYLQGQYVEADAVWTDGLAVARQRGDPWTTANLLTGLGNIALWRRDLPRARACLRESLMLQADLGVGGRESESLEGWAFLEIAEGRPERAMRLAGAAAGLRKTYETALPDLFKQSVDARLEPVWRSLGKSAAKAAWAAGQGMNLKEAVAYALHGVEPRTRTEVGLTQRELDVAVLLSRGFTNQQIADQIVVSPATAKRHVENILEKLGLVSRAQIAAWAAQRGLVPDSNT